MIDKTREVALKTLYKIDKEQAYSNIALDEMLKQNKNILNEKDIGLISEIVYGVTTWKLTLDEIIKKYSKIRIKKISPRILNILRMGIYQIIFLDKIPKSAAVNESVNLSKRYGHQSSSNFVNAILRKVEKKDYEDFFEIEDDKERISKTTSMPMWIIEELLRENTIKEVEEICKASNERPKITIRVNSLKVTPNKLQEKLEQKGIKVEEGILKDFLVLSKVKNIENLEEFKKGYFTIQDEAAGLCALMLQPQKEDKILDACSSPGGKTTYLAELMNNQGKIDAWDIHEHRTKLVEEATKRLEIFNIQTRAKDATKYDEKYKESFDKILLDVPCLGLGVIKRKPDIKWQRDKEDIKEICKVQEQILETCSKYLKNGGTLVYSTCSILKEENEKNIQKFLSKNAQFKIIKPELEKESYFEKYCKNNKYIQVYQNSQTDGFFICKLHKSE